MKDTLSTDLASAAALEQHNALPDFDAGDRDDGPSGLQTPVPVELGDFLAGIDTTAPAPADLPF